MATDSLRWFAVRSVYQSPSPADDSVERYSYEERLVLFRAESAADAIRQAEAEAAVYTKTGPSHSLGYFETYDIEDEIGPGAEVFSLIRDSSLEDEEYLGRHFDTGLERRGALE